MKPCPTLLTVTVFMCLSLFGCGNEVSLLTQIIVTVDSDLRVPDEIDSLEIRVAGRGMAEPATADLTKNGTPRTLSLVHDSGPFGPITIVARGLREGALVIEQAAEVYFVEGTTIKVYLTLSQACKDVTCQTGDTCAEGACVPIDSFQPGSEGGFTAGGNTDVQDASGPDASGGSDGGASGGSDGGASGGGSDGGTSAGSAPMCNVTFPVLGDAYQVNKPASLSGSCHDNESGPITSTAYWTSDRQSTNLASGVVATGTFTQGGQHTLRLCARDPQDASVTGCSDGVVVTVTSTVQPTATIESVTQGGGGPPFVTGSAITMTGAGTGAGIGLSWRDSLVGPVTGDTSASMTFPLLGKHVVTLTATDREEVAVSASRSFTVLAPGQSTLVSPFTGPNPTLGSVNAMLVSPMGVGYAASHDGKLYQFDPSAPAGSATVVLDSVQLPDLVKDGFIDAGLSAVYLATAGGLVRCKYTSASGIHADECSSYTTTSTMNSDLPSDDLLSVARIEGSNRQQYVLVGTSDGLLRSTPASPNTGSTHLAGTAIYDIAVDVINQVAWLATSDGLYRYAPVGMGSLTKIPESGQPSASMRSVALGSDGSLWVGSNDGLGRWQPSLASWTVWTTEDGLVSDDLRAVAVSQPLIGGVRRDVLWIGAEAGVSRFDPSLEPASFMDLTVTDGLPSDQTHNVVVMSDGSKLIATSSGIARYVGL